MSEESSNSTDDARNARNLLLEEYNRRMQLQQSAYREISTMKPNDYLWQPGFNDVFSPGLPLEETENKPNESENKPNENKPNESENKPNESENKPNENEDKPNESENKPNENENKPNENKPNENKPNENEQNENFLMHIKEFPNRMSELIYRYVVEVLNCYERRITQYSVHSVFPHLEAYKKKVYAVKVAFENNVLGICDKLEDFEFANFKMDIDCLSSKVTALYFKLKFEWVKCKERFAFLKEIKTEMPQCCFDREILRSAKTIARELVDSLKKAHKLLHDCLDKVKEFYDFLNDVQDALVYHQMTDA